MSNYRRARVPGACFFFTLVLADRKSNLLTKHIDDLRHAYAETIRDAPVTCDAMVVLPDHLHAIWTLPPGDAAFSERWRKIKYRFSKRTGLWGRRSLSQCAKRERGIWQRRFWEHVIRDEADYRAHLAYCWANPVKHGLVARAADWPFSSIHREIRSGHVDCDWHHDVSEGRFGE